MTAQYRERDERVRGPADVAAERAALREAVAAWGYTTRGVASEPLIIASQRVLEIGMGGGPFSVAAIEAGARAYLGVDPHVGTDHVRDFRSLTDRQWREYAPFPFSCAQIMRLYPNVRLVRAHLEEVADEARRFHPDVAVLWGVTEHLRDPQAVIRTTWEALRRDGVIWLTHNNYYSWIGHHADPRRPEAWDRGDPAHNAVVDWRHLDAGHPMKNEPNLNRIRLADLRDLIETYFEIVEFSYEVHALARLTPEVRRRRRHFPAEELLAGPVRICGRRRDMPRDGDLTARQFYHPGDDYMTGGDFSGEDIGRFGAMGYVYFGPKGQLASHSDNDYAGRRAFRGLQPGQNVRLRKGPVALQFTVSHLEPRDDGNLLVILREPVGTDLRTVHRAMWILEPASSD